MTIIAVDAASAHSGKMAAADGGVGLGNREDVADYIINISPEETPLFTNLAKKRATAITHEWLTDSLADAATNKYKEGTVFTTDTMSARTRVSNVCQISRKVYEVTGSQEAVAQYGVKSEMSYRAVMAAKELKRDINFDLWQNITSAQDSADITGNARQINGMHTSIATAHSGGASYLAAALTGAAAESTFNDVLEDIFTDGHMANICYMRPSIKKLLSRWTGVATKNFDQQEKMIVNVIDIYQSDFGTVTLIMDRQMESPATETNHQVVAGNFEYAAVAFLRPFQTKRLPEVKDAHAGVIQTEYTLEYGNSNSYGFLKASTA